MQSPKSITQKSVAECLFWHKMKGSWWFLQVHVAASKGERQEHADKLQHQHEKGTGSAEDSAVVQPYVDSSKPLETIKAARSPSPKRQPVGDNGKSRVNDRKEGENGQKASIKTSAPTKTAHKASKSKGKSLNANSVSTKPLPNHSSSSSSNNRQVEAAPAFTAKASKGNHSDTPNSINGDPSHSKAGGRQSTNSKTTFINNKAAGNTSSKAQHKPVAVDTTGFTAHMCLAATTFVLSACPRNCMLTC